MQLSASGQGISKELYNQLVQQEEEIDFYCKECGLPAEESSIPQLPDFESTRYSTDGVHEASFSLEQSTVSTHEESHSPNQSTLDVHLPDTSEVYDQSTIVQLNNSSFTVSDEEDTTIHLNNLDQSFDITQRTFAEPDIITETSIQDDPLPDQLTDAIDQPTYSVVDGASQRGKRKLVDVDGYTYTVKVFQALKDLLPQSAVRGFVADFESGVWQALKEVFPGMMINGCLFHFTQAVFRHVQFLGLQPAYRQQDCIFKYVRKLMALPFLPADHIRPAFRRLKDLQTDPLQRLVTYVEDTWIKSTVWPVESWTVFSQPTRTNNDVEGWHRRINKKSSEEKKPFYLLLPKLKEEAELLPNQLKMVSECKLTRQQRSTSKFLQAKYFQLWDQYRDGDLTASQLVRMCGLFVCPRIKRHFVF
ncbi:unnamed protein product [Mytilus edulis]|uniref:MULE transposase domain-containing protein n=1 Tax=Mytilus edulis TaxID=6550 RepID=A0A8S3UQ70_MYTED|nr:unnamed protein product [Mytilus edulis]